MSRVTFLGLGIMGRGMVGNLLDAGHEVTIWNRTPGKGAELEDRGAVRAETGASAVEGAEYVMYCLANDEAVREIVLGSDGIIDAVPEDAVVIDLSTISPEVSLAEHEAFEGRGIPFLDAPVFGSRGEADGGGLWIVVGGDEQTCESARPVLEPLAATLHYMGAPGNGARMKLVGNLLVAAQLESLGEAFALAKRSGLDLDAVHDVITVTDFRTPIYEGVGAAVLEGDYSTDFALELMLKDARLIEDLAQRVDSPIPATEATIRTIQRAVDAGYGDQNASALIKVLAEDAGVRLER